MADQIRRLVAVVPRRRNELVGGLSELIGRMREITKLNPLAVVDQENTKVPADMAIAKGVEIIEEREISERDIMKPVGLRQGCTERRRKTPVDAEASGVARTQH